MDCQRWCRSTHAEKSMDDHAGRDLVCDTASRRSGVHTDSGNDKIRSH